MLPLLIPAIGWQELLIVLLIVIIIFGASRLPELGGAIGRSIKEFRASVKEAAPEGSEEHA